MRTVNRLKELIDLLAPNHGDYEIKFFGYDEDEFLTAVISHTNKMIFLTDSEDEFFAEMKEVFDNKPLGPNWVVFHL